MATPSGSLSTKRVLAVLEHLEETARLLPPDRSERRPVHVLYGGAHLFRADTPDKLGRIARSSMATYAEDAAAFGKAVGVDDPALAVLVAARVEAKLEHEPVEAMCIDFEDGYGVRPDDDEDGDAVRTGEALAALPAGAPVVGIRVKPISGATGRRCARTLDLFVTAFARASAGKLRPGFTVTLPKVERPAEVTTFVELLDMLEDAAGLRRGVVGLELMIESPRALVDDTGRIALGALVEAAGGRCVAVHLGAYDLTAAMGVAATDQRLDHPLCDHARVLMQLALAGSGVAVVDGATTTLPIPPHAPRPDAPLGDAERAANARAVLDAWSLHARNVRRALDVGIHEGWDLHPSQLPARYGAVFASYLAQRAAMGERLRDFVGRATRATRTGQVFDDAATGQGLVNFFLRGLACGALDEADLRATGLTEDELRSRSFARIVAARADVLPVSSRGAP